MEQTDILVIGAGLTGLTTAYTLARRGKDVLVLEREGRTGGQIRSFHERGYTFESGPNTSIINCPEVAELFADLAADTGEEILETARPGAKRRLIWKGKRFLTLPNGPLSGISTPLIPWHDKIRLLFEPWRKPGNDPLESVAALARRRLGKSFVDYAVDPFISGIYAGDPHRLVTKYALPKLYNLEQNYGSFIRGAYAKRAEPKTERDRLVTKEVFSTHGGLQRLTDTLTNVLAERVRTHCQPLRVAPDGDGGWRADFEEHGAPRSVTARRVVLTIPAYELPAVLPFLTETDLSPITTLRYAPIVQVSVGMPASAGLDFDAFGGLVPSIERQQVLGILFPSSCFSGRTPEGGIVFSFFLGGIRHPEFIEKSDEEIRTLIDDGLYRMLGFPRTLTPDVVRIFRHRRAIPQYEASTKERLEAVALLEKKYPGLTLAGNLRDGIGVSNRIAQGRQIGMEMM